jgi:hypothetical protein
MSQVDRQSQDLETILSQARLDRLYSFLLTSGSHSLAFGEALPINGFRGKTEGEFEVRVNRMLTTGEGDLVQVDYEWVTQADLKLVQDQLDKENSEPGPDFGRKESIRSAALTIQEKGQAAVTPTNS